jgi:23S rRNA (cytosine1962-C5)-methyltransferase
LIRRGAAERQKDFVEEGSVIIGPRGIERFRSGHLWVYRSDVRSANAKGGAIVRLTDDRGRFHGRAFYSDKSQIAIRLLTRDDVPIDRAFFTERMHSVSCMAKQTTCPRLSLTAMATTWRCKR